MGVNSAPCRICEASLLEGRSTMACVDGLCFRILALLLNFLVGENLNFRAIASLRHFFSRRVRFDPGWRIRNPLMLLGQLSLVLLVVFAADASFTVWRRGDRRTAMTVGGSIVFFTLVGACQSLVVLWGLIQVPLTASLFFMGVIGDDGIRTELRHFTRVAT